MVSELSQADFEALVRRAELPLTPAQVAQLYEAWPYVAPMLERIRSTVRGRVRGREAEPALIFRAEPLP